MFRVQRFGFYVVSVPSFIEIHAERLVAHAVLHRPHFDAKWPAWMLRRRTKAFFLDEALSGKAMPAFSSAWRPNVWHMTFGTAIVPTGTARPIEQKFVENETLPCHWRE